MITNFFEIFVLSIIQGVSEFLPISSAAHLIIASNIYEFKNQSLLIDISLHLGSLLAILFYFRNEIFSLNNNNFWFNPALLGRGYSETQRQKFCALVHSSIVVFIPNSTDRLPLPC